MTYLLLLALKQSSPLTCSCAKVNVLETDVLPFPNVSDEGLTIYAYSKGGNNVGVRDVHELVLVLCEALDIVTDALPCLAFAS